jgi:hypothetical protein
VVTLGCEPAPLVFGSWTELFVALFPVYRFLIPSYMFLVWIVAGGEGGVVLELPDQKA